MDWINAQQLPEETGNYVASVRMPYLSGQYVFEAIVHYDRDTQRWYKYEPFEPDKELGDDITDKVVGWVKSRETYLG
jgi:hypothetical protein